MPDWVTSYKLYGDFRGRFDDLTTDSSRRPASSQQPRTASACATVCASGMLVDMKDGLQVGFRLGSGDATGGQPKLGWQSAVQQHHAAGQRHQENDLH